MVTGYKIGYTDWNYLRFSSESADKYLDINLIKPRPPRLKRPGYEVDHSPPSSAEIKNAWSYTSTPHNDFMAWYLQGQLTLPLS